MCDVGRYFNSSRSTLGSINRGIKSDACHRTFGDERDLGILQFRHRVPNRSDCAANVVDLLSLERLAEQV